MDEREEPETPAFLPPHAPGGGPPPRFESMPDDEGREPGAAPPLRSTEPAPEPEPEPEPTYGGFGPPAGASPGALPPSPPPAMPPQGYQPPGPGYEAPPPGVPQPPPPAPGQIRNPFGSNAPGQPPGQNTWATSYVQPAREGNGPAIAALVLGIVGLLLFVIDGLGLLFFLNLPCSVMAWYFGRQGMKKFDSGRTQEHRGVAKAGMITGIVGTVLGVLAIILWALLIIFDEQVRDELEDILDDGEDNDSNDDDTTGDFFNTVRLFGLAARLGGRLLL